ncbi:MAG: L-threonylcarbamoyladenylate synthase [bacterium]
MRFVAATPQAMKEAAAVLRAGGLVAFPTETVYGLGADATNAAAVARVFEVKNRPRFDPIIVHVADPSDLGRLCRSPGRKAERLTERFWPGPLTVVLTASRSVPEIVRAGLPTVAVRMPSHPVALALIRGAGRPIAAPSANPFGYLSPTCAEHVREQIGAQLDLILDGGRCPVGLESTVIDLTQADPVLLRPGGLPLEQIEEVIGRVKVSPRRGSRPRSPGQLSRHYSPRTPLRILHKEQPPPIDGRRRGLLAFKAPSDRSAYERVEILSPSGHLKEAAANLFSCLQRLDKTDLDIIYAEPVPEVGLGRAIMDRLRRASTRGEAISLISEVGCDQGELTEKLKKCTKEKGI